MTTSETHFGMVRVSYENFRYVEWHPVYDPRRLVGMEKDTEVKQKGSEQPPTRVGYDDERTQQKKDQE